MLAAVTVLAATTDLTRLLDSVREAGPAAAAAFLLLYVGCTLAGVPRHTLSTTTGVVTASGGDCRWPTSVHCSAPAPHSGSHEGWAETP
jgi:hypothetical protein